MVALLHSVNGYCIGINSSNTALQEAVSTALQTVMGNGLSEVVQAKWLGETLDLSGLPVTSSTSAAPAEDDRANAETGANGEQFCFRLSPLLRKCLAEGQAASSGASDTGEAGSNAVSLEEATGVSSGQSEEDAQ